MVGGTGPFVGAHGTPRRTCSSKPQKPVNSDFRIGDAAPAMIPVPRLLLAAVLACASLVLAACGGGGDGDDSPSNGTPPVGKRLNETYCPLAYYQTEPADPLSGPDPLFGSQWFLRNTGQAGGLPGEDLRIEDAWATVDGRGIRVAVLDSGIEVIHEDLLPNIVPGGSFNYRAGVHHGSAYPLPCANGNVHGTAVAGIVAARGNNALGGSGVAPAASLVGLNPLATNSDADIAHALGYERESNAIYSNSWGSPDTGVLYASDSSFDAAIERGVSEGRDGLGSIFVFPAGNGAYFGDSSNFDGYVNKRGQVTVCAVDDRGEKSWYSESGANVLLCAPSSGLRTAVTTTGLRNRYIDDFTGTSASTPMVSGVVALMLEANPALTWRDVQLVLATSARRNSPDSAGWIDAYGLHYHPDFGFGTVDAAAAVALARDWSSVGGSAQQKSCVSEVHHPNLPVPDDAPADAVSDTITISACDIEAIEFIEVRFTASHTHSGDLAISLTSPNGLVSRLANARTCSMPASSGSQRTTLDCGRYDDWRFGSVRHMNEPATGDWTLRVGDLQRPGDSGTFESWQMRIWGR